MTQFRLVHKTCAPTANFPFVLIQQFHTSQSYHPDLKFVYGSTPMKPNRMLTQKGKIWKPK